MHAETKKLKDANAYVCVSVFAYTIHEKVVAHRSCKIKFNEKRSEEKTHKNPLKCHVMKLCMRCNRRNEKKNARRLVIVGECNCSYAISWAGFVVVT